MATPALPRFELRLLGAFGCEQREIAGGTVISRRSIRLPTRKAEALLAYLVLYPSSHPRERLAALFWGDSPEERARGSLRRALTALRAELGKDFLLARSSRSPPSSASRPRPPRRRPASSSRSLRSSSGPRSSSSTSCTSSCGSARPTRVRTS